MSDEKSNLEDREEEDIFDETETSNESEGDGTKDNVSAEDEALRVYNERTGKTFKSWDDVQKSTKEADKLFAKGTHKQEEPSPSTSVAPNVYEEELLTLKYPEAETILDDISDIAKKMGKGILEVYRQEKWLQDKAKAVSEEIRIEQENKSKINAPSNGTPTKTKDDIKSVKPEDVDKLSPSDKAKWVQYQVERESRDE
jgi:predicted Zn-dependent protease